MRPLALQGDIGYEAAVTGERERHATYDMVLEYSVPYLNRFIRNANTRFDVERNLPAESLKTNSRKYVPIRRIQRFDPAWGYFGFERDLSPTGGCLRRQYFQISAAADVPLRGYLPSRRVGAVVLFDLFLDELVPALGWTPFGKHHHHDNEH